MEELRASPGEWLFRGQTEVHKDIRPSLARLAEPTRTQMWNVCRQFHRAAAGVTGYEIRSPWDRLGVLQHYVGVSPLVDFTGSPLVALYFALLNSSRASRVVYALQRAALDDDVVVAEHSFLLTPLNESEHRHRWLRQDGYSIGPGKWPDMTAVLAFDVLALPDRRRGADDPGLAVEAFEFDKLPGDDDLVAELGDLEEVANDPLAVQVRGVVNTLARHLGFESAGIEAILSKSKTIDPDELLRKRISRAHEQAHEGQELEALKYLEGLTKTLRAGLWDLSHECALEWVEAKLRHRSE